MIVNLNQIEIETDKVFFVTGANSGLGYETTKFILQKGGKVIMGCRDLIKGNRAKKKLLNFNYPGIIDLIEIDLSDLRKVKKAAKLIKSNFDYLDVLINNAGIMAPPRTLSKQGFEIQFAVNHLAHMSLTLELLPLLNKRNNSRVVTVSSGVQYFGKISWEDLQGEQKYDRWAAYSQSKLANVMFGLELNSILRGNNSNTSSLLAHPGFAKTNLQPKSVAANKAWQEELAYKLMNPMFQSAQMGSLPQLAAAISPNAKGGEQYGPKFNFRGYPKICKSASKALDQTSRKRLWNISKGLIESV